MNKLWEFKTDRFRIVLTWEWEDYPDISWDETGEVLEKLNSGEWGNYTFYVTIYLDGTKVAQDSLGNSIYADPVEFVKEHFGERRSSYFTDMVREAIATARRELCRPRPRLRCASVQS